MWLLQLYCIARGSVWIFCEDVVDGVSVVCTYFVQLITLFTSFIYMKLFESIYMSAFGSYV
jgi:hypothetical protein